MWQIGVSADEPIPADGMVYLLFDDTARKDKLWQTFHAVKERFGKNSLVRATGLRNNVPIDLIGFNSIKDLWNV